MIKFLTYAFLTGYVLVPSYGLIDYNLICLAIVCMLNMKRYVKLDNHDFYNLLLFYITLFFLACLSVIINLGSIDPLYFLKPIRFLIATILLSIAIKWRSFDFNDALNIIIICGILNLSFTIFQYVGANIFDLDVPKIGTNIRSTNYRMSGLASGFPASSLLLVLSLIATIMKFLLFRNNWYLFLIIAFSLGHFIISRTGLLMTACVLCYYLILSKFITKFWVGAAVGMAFYLLFLFTKNTEILFIQRTLSLMLEIFLTGGISSFDSLIEKHFTFPSDIKTFFIGSMIPAWDLTGARSDVFWSRYLYGVGLVALLLYCLLYFYLSARAFKKIKVFCPTVKHLMIYRQGIILACCIFFIINFKGSYIFSRFAFDGLYMLLLSAIFARQLKCYRY